MGTYRPQHWSRAEHAAWARKLALGRLEAWEAELAAGRRPLTPQLAEAIRADRVLVDHIDRELAEQEAPAWTSPGPPPW